MSSHEGAAEVFKDYVKNKKIVIADPSAVSRASLASAMTAMGALPTNIALALDYNAAEQEIARLKPEIVICDYDLGKRCGLELLQKQRQIHPDSKQSLFILVTGNTSQTAVARAAEEDVDTYILKPFTVQLLRSSIMRAALAKTQPSPYVRAVENGKKELASGNIDIAIEMFEHAKTLDSSPSLACYYLGQASLLKQALEMAEGSYNKGLAYNKIHYKCMVGLYEMLMSEKRHAEAYEVVKRISHYFPANPQRLTAVLKLAVVTQSYDDVERYYQIYTKIDERNDEIIRYICAALVVCGKYYLNNNHKTRALELFRKAAVTASGRTIILREVVLALVETGFAKEAAEYLKRFNPKDQGEPTYLSLELLVLDRSDGSASIVIEKGRQLISRGVHDPLIYRTLIRRSREAGLGPAAESLMDEAIKRWPDLKAEFEKT